MSTDNFPYLFTEYKWLIILAYGCFITKINTYISILLYLQYTTIHRSAWLSAEKNAWNPFSGLLLLIIYAHTAYLFIFFPHWKLLFFGLYKTNNVIIVIFACMTLLGSDLWFIHTYIYYEYRKITVDIDY